MFNRIKKFLKNELNGIKRAWHYSEVGSMEVDPPRSELLTKEKFPEHYEIAKKISDDSNVYPDKTVINDTIANTKSDTYARAKSRKIEMGRGILKDRENFEWTYAHELGHVKHRKFHNVIDYINKPYNLLLGSTTCLYTIGFLTHPVGIVLKPFIKHDLLDAANWLFNHTSQYMLLGIAINAITIRVREHQSDLFAYKYTNILPSKHLNAGEYKPTGVIDRVSHFTNRVVGKILSGYPTKMERDWVCKIGGKKSQKSSFAEKLNTERQQHNDTPSHGAGQILK